MAVKQSTEGRQSEATLWERKEKWLCEQVNLKLAADVDIWHQKLSAVKILHRKQLGSVNWSVYFGLVGYFHVLGNSC